MECILPTRQVHLDFHTSQFIPGIGAEFDADEFVKTFKEAHVNSVTVFARCHHGYLYYQSEAFPELVHPYLKRENLVLDQIDALHAAGIRAPVYTTIQWDRYTAEHHPEWLIRKYKGEHEGGSFAGPGFYQSLCVNTGYADFIQEHMKELLSILGDRTDGFFFDITGIRPCLCSVCLPMMRDRNIDLDDEVAVQKFAKESIDGFKKKLTKIVHDHTPDATIFYNAGHIGPCTKDSCDKYTHYEIESLPSGGWGYLHFPVSARYARTLGRDCMGMTGKFHTSWGDFHSLKNLAALEFECFRILSYGFAVSIGDQLEPYGKLNPATYNLIGKVYERIEQCEEWARPANPVIEAALITSECDLYEHQMPNSVMGAVQMLEEIALQFDIIDLNADFSKYKLLILPDDLVVDSDVQRRLDTFAAAGGAVIACYKGGSNEAGEYPDCFGVVCNGENENYPDFIVTGSCNIDTSLTAGLEPENEYVIYRQGLRISADSEKASVELETHAPYFPRKGDHFCSHLYTPSAKGEKYPVAIQNGNVITFSHPVFEQYRANAPRWCKQIINNAVNKLLPNRITRHNGPSTMTVTVSDQPEHSRANIHLLSYITVRKSAEIDIIEERTVLRDIKVNFYIPGKEIKSARIVPEDIPLILDDNTVTIPEVNGYAVVELKY